MRHFSVRRQSGGLVLIAVLLQLAGCAGSSEPVREYGDVFGTVKYAGKPLTMGTVMFQPPSGAIASGEIKSDGSYSLKGVIGPNIVMIVCRDPEPKEPEGPKVKKAAVVPKSHIPESYGVPSSPLSFEVGPGENVADFELK